MNKIDVINFVKSNTKFDFSSNILEMYISNDKVYLKDIKNTFDNIVFEETIDEKGWFVWIDPCTIANWSHVCFYFFVNEDCFLQKSNEWIPSMDLEKVDLN